MALEQEENNNSNNLICKSVNDIISRMKNPNQYLKAVQKIWKNASRYHNKY